jgi:hypothetical protein
MVFAVFMLPACSESRFGLRGPAVQWTEQERKAITERADV